jgi:predicted helicase
VKLWAIQAKAYHEATWITKRDVDTFLAESGRPQFSFRLLIATTDRIGHNAKRTLDAQEKCASFLGLAGLEAAEVNWPGSPSGPGDGSVVPRMGDARVSPWITGLFRCARGSGRSPIR